MVILTTIIIVMQDFVETLSRLIRNISATMFNGRVVFRELNLLNNLFTVRNIAV